MAICRVYLFTYKRNHLLPRAVKSLTEQTFTDWICEVHNDDPTDSYPEQYISSLNDARFVMHTHKQNMGAVRSFNLAFAGFNENYAAILEDDNWWEPEFLSTLISFLENKPEVKMAWSNMRLWQELPGNNWEDTQKTVWPQKEDQIFHWGENGQLIGHLHSNGAMVYRKGMTTGCIVPDNVLLNAIEAVRERAFQYPIALLAKPLANFAITISTNRSADANKWIATQIMLLASYINASPDPENTFAASLIYHRKLRPSPIANFYLANSWLIRNKSLNRYFSFSDILFSLKWGIRNCLSIKKIHRYINDNRAVYDYLLLHTKQRFKEAREL